MSSLRSGRARGAARVDQAGVVSFQHADHLGSGASATNAAGAVLWRERYTPFGEKLLAPAANDNQASFTGHIDDAATGLTYMQARYYDPALGRFLSIDPVEFSAARPDMFNRYAYAANDPVNMIDPDGRIPGVPGPLVQYAYATPDQKAAMVADAQAAVAGAAVDAALTTLEVGLIVADLAAGGPTGEGIAPAAAIRTARAAEATGASSAISRLGLQKKLASESQLGQLAEGGGTIISQPARQADRIATQYGVSASDVQKVSSDAFTASDGTHIETHAFRDASTNQLFEAKTKVVSEP